MPNPTNRDLLTTALLARGYVRDERARAIRYQTFAPGGDARSLLKPGNDHRVYLGRAGALRFSTQCTVATSVPFGESTRERLLTEGRLGGLDAYLAATKSG